MKQLSIHESLNNVYRKSIKDVKYMTNAPIYKERAGSVSIAVFDNTGKTKDGKDYSYKSVNLQKSYKDKNDQWVNKDLSMKAEDIPKAVALLQEAYKQCVMKQEKQ